MIGIFLVFLIVLGFFIAVIATVISIILFIVFGVRKKHGQPAKAHLISAIVLASIGANLLITEVLTVNWGFSHMERIPSDYVETGKKIEENGYQSYRFTVDGVCYYRLDLEPNELKSLENLIPVFSYYQLIYGRKTNWGNYYKVPSSAPHPIYMGHYGDFFAEEGHGTDIINYYNEEVPRSWQMRIELKRFLVKDKNASVFTSNEKELKEEPLETISFSYSDIQEVIILSKISNDEIMRVVDYTVFRKDLDFYLYVQKFPRGEQIMVKGQEAIERIKFRSHG